MKPQIVNIINFIRGIEPRDPNLDLLEPVVNQIRLLKEYQLPGTFLLQYDALIQDRFSGLLGREAGDHLEIGGWFEIVQPLVEKAGLKWRGRPGFAWDWHAHTGFSVGYLPEEREKLVDVYMEDFRAIFGRYPQSMGAWIIDAHTLGYMADKYGIVASCICRDQWGTDGYSLWGGYYNQGYYPSRKNVFAPAQKIENQIPVPVFRMLGSDPIYQYDAGLIDGDTFQPSGNQPVITLEPVYPEAGGSPEWVRWYFRENFNGNCLSFGYTQVGQENSFGWPAMEKGLTDQLQWVAQKVKESKLSVWTLAETGKWYSSQFTTTTASSLAALEDWQHQGRRSVWFYNRFYRVNLYQEENKLWIRDIHKFDERYAERYLSSRCPGESFVYDNLPVMDGNRWSKGSIRAGVRPVRIQPDGSTHEITGKDIQQVEDDKDGLRVSWLLDEGGSVLFECKVDRMEIHFGTAAFATALEMKWGDGVETEIMPVSEKCIHYEHNGYPYDLLIMTGSLQAGDKKNSLLIHPESGKITLKLA